MNKFKFYYLELRNSFMQNRIQNDNRFKYNRIAAELIRNTHSIEKGLSIENPRLGFGHKKQEDMMRLIKVLKNSNSEYHKESIKMAIDALYEYIIFHENKNYTDEFIEKLRKFVEENETDTNYKYGGVQRINKKDMDFDIEEIERFFNTRHSIRDFEKSEVDNSKLRKALELAQRSPSACNRQGVRAYVLSKEQFKQMDGWLDGIGGFADKVNKYVLITSKLTSYRDEESCQHIVSASMYAAYLSLTLHLYGLGACVVQRAVTYSKKWKDLRKKWRIPDDEQAICILSVGNLKQSYTVPISHRLQNNEMIKFL